MKLNTLRSWAPAALAVAALTACGGNDDQIYLPPVAEDPTMVPASATANAAAFSNYVASLPANDSADPLTVSALVPPVSDTDEPVLITR
jgi:hypothetical protein